MKTRVLSLLLGVYWDYLCVPAPVEDRWKLR